MARVVKNKHGLFANGWILLTCLGITEKSMESNYWHSAHFQISRGGGWEL